VIASLREDISRLEKILSELRVSADKALKNNEELKQQLGQAQVHAGAATQLVDAQSKSQVAWLVFISVKTYSLLYSYVTLSPIF